MRKSSIGVIVGRFQVPYLHSGHQFLISHLAKNHSKRIIFIGTSVTPPSKQNPMDFETRKLLISRFDPEATILQIPDHRSDQTWSANLDAAIEDIYPDSKVVLYGGRDSFLKSYCGKFEKHYVEAFSPVSGTELRVLTSFEPKESNDFRAGIIYSAYKYLPKVYMTVDIAVTRIEEGGLKVLLGTKAGVAGLRFPGGFVDATDESLAYAAKRELMEETDIAVEGDLTYIGSYSIADWRYKGSDDKIMTTFFHGEYTFGSVFGKAKDDLSTVGWYPITDETLSNIVPEHVVLFKELRKFLKVK